MEKAESRTFLDIISDYKDLIYPGIIYIAGLIIGTALFKFSNGSFNEIISKIINTDSADFLALFFNRFSIYISVYAVTVVFGMCLIGLPFIYCIPLITGVVIAFKTAYFYLNYKAKGIGYSLLMIIPESAAFETVLILTINKATYLSKYIFKETLNKTDMTEEINLKSYLKCFVIYLFFIAFISLINALLTYLLSSIITL